MKDWNIASPHHIQYDGDPNYQRWQTCTEDAVGNL